MLIHISRTITSVINKAAVAIKVMIIKKNKLTGQTLLSSFQLGIALIKMIS